MNHPPNPPDIHEAFKYLSAVFPENEAQRTAACEMLQKLWSQWPNEQANEVMQTARQTFETGGASISIFDHDHEIFRCEHGYVTEQGRRERERRAREKREQEERDTEKRPGGKKESTEDFKIPREQSIAAHALLTPDVFVIPDTKRVG